MVILDPYGITFDAVDVFGLAFYLLFKSCSTYCVLTPLIVHTTDQASPQQISIPFLKGIKIKLP